MFKPKINGFWGPKMNAVFEHLRSIGFSYSYLTPSQFANEMDLLIRRKTDHKRDPEACAAEWLEGLNG